MCRTRAGYSDGGRFGSDHEWGRNVFAYGLSSTGATLAARYLPVTWALHVVTNTPTPGWGKLWVCPPDVDSWDSYFGVEFYGGGGNFPYGLDVSADAPL